MTISLSDWLTLREPFDHAARSMELVHAIDGALPRDRAIRVIDLGTGAGSNVRYLGTRLSAPQEWLLVDADPDVLAHAASRLASVGPALSCETRCQDLGDFSDAVVAGRDLVTASALLDLVSASWIDRLAHACRAAHAVALFALTYNGESSCSPVEPEDDSVRELLNRHQRNIDKGFGRAAGPDAVDCAARSFSAAGFTVQRQRSDWDLGPDARDLQRHLVQGWADAAIEMEPGKTATIQNWLARRLDHIDAGRSHISVQHEDVAAI